MFYSNTSKLISIGDRVLIDGEIKGLVVCDYDSWICLNTYERWLTKEQLIGFGTLSTGLMIETEDFGFLHYAHEVEDISPDTLRRV